MMEHDCIFCKILNNEIPSEKVYEDEKVYGFKDIYPQAKEHYLFIHKEHTNSVKEMPLEQISDVFNAIQTFTKDKSGFRVVTNVGEDGGQTVFHTHFHVLGGERLKGFGA